MKKSIAIVCILSLLSFSCSNNKPNYKGVTPKSVGINRCGIKDDQKTLTVSQYYRGPVNGGHDDDQDGHISATESFAYWDFQQLTMVLESGIEWDTYTWTNIDTCYFFTVIAGEFYEDSSQPLLWTTCRDFAFKVKDNLGKNLGGIDKNTACRNHGTHQWVVL